MLARNVKLNKLLVGVFNLSELYYANITEMSSILEEKKLCAL